MLAQPEAKTIIGWAPAMIKLAQRVSSARSFAIVMDWFDDAMAITPASLMLKEKLQDLEAALILSGENDTGQRALLLASENVDSIELRADRKAYWKKHETALCSVRGRVVEQMKKDWPMGLNLKMIAQLEVATYLDNMRRTSWSAFKLTFANGKVPELPSPKAMSDRLAHYFHHFLYEHQPNLTDTDSNTLWFLSFLPSSTPNAIASTYANVVILPISHTPYFLVSLIQPGLVPYIMAAMTHTFGAVGVDSAGLKGRDVLGMKTILTSRCAVNTWKDRAGGLTASDDPLGLLHRRVREDLEQGRREAQYLTTSSKKSSVPQIGSIRADSDDEAGHHVDFDMVREIDPEVRKRRRDEMENLFSTNDELGIAALPKLTDLNYHLTLPNKETVQIKLKGNHVLYGLAALVQSGLADRGLPPWLAQIQYVQNSKSVSLFDHGEWIVSDAPESRANETQEPMEFTQTQLTQDRRSPSVVY